MARSTKPAKSAKAVPKKAAPKTVSAKAKVSPPASPPIGHPEQPPSGYWLLKSEPDSFSWTQQKERGAKGEPWTGVRNFLARNNMKAMRLGDLAFFYHSNEGKEVVGIVKVIALAHPDPTDDTGNWQCVDVEAVCDMPAPVTLDAIKASSRLADMVLVRTSRLSVQPVSAKEWAEVCRMGGLDPKALPRRA